MLRITGSEIVTDTVNDESGVTYSPTQHFLKVTDQGGNEYLIPTNEGTSTAVQELIEMITENLRTIKTA
ncbi:MAG: hypothetical protein PHY47_01235 [Lachnospiraceae bacterium]|nr:hypothetical protein [Lachnospiraceae bacterium]